MVLDGRGNHGAAERAAEMGAGGGHGAGGRLGVRWACTKPQDQGLAAELWRVVASARYGREHAVAAGERGLGRVGPADSAPPELRGRSSGVFNLMNGGALLLASVLAGARWSAFGAPATFAALAAARLIAYPAGPRSA
jgi:hypothetical protein